MRAMRVLSAIVLALLVCTSAAFADTMIDVVYLKNGSIVRGTITERQTFPEVKITIKTGDGSVFVFTADQIEKITQEQAASGGAAVTAGDVPMSPNAIEVNLLGLLQFGPYVRYHINVGNDLFVSPHVRVGYIGLLYYVLDWWTDLGVGASLLKYWPSGLGAGRFYAGGVLETELLRGDGAPLSGFAAIANFGYRFRSVSRPGYWQLGVLVGAAYSLVDDVVTPFGMLELSWGTELNRSKTQ